MTFHLLKSVPYGDPSSEHYPGLFRFHTQRYETHHLDPLGPSTRKYDDFTGRAIPQILFRQVSVLALNITRLPSKPSLHHQRPLSNLHIDWSTYIFGMYISPPNMKSKIEKCSDGRRPKHFLSIIGSRYTSDLTYCCLFCRPDLVTRQS